MCAPATNCLATSAYALSASRNGPGHRRAHTRTQCLGPAPGHNKLNTAPVPHINAIACPVKPGCAGEYGFFYYTDEVVENTLGNAECHHSAYGGLDDSVNCRLPNRLGNNKARAEHGSHTSAALGLAMVAAMALVLVLVLH